MPANPMLSPRGSPGAAWIKRVEGRVVRPRLPETRRRLTRCLLVRAALAASRANCAGAAHHRWDVLFPASSLHSGSVTSPPLEGLRPRQLRRRMFVPDFVTSLCRT